MNGSRDNPSGGTGVPSRRPGGGPPPLGARKRPAAPGGSAGRPPAPTRPDSGWSDRDRLLLGVGGGLVIAMLGITCLLATLWLFQTTASADRPDSSDSAEATADMTATDKAAVARAAAEKAAADKAAAEKAAAEKAAEDKAAADEAAAEKAAEKAAEEKAAEMAAAGKEAAEEMAAAEMAAAQKSPFADILSRNCLLPLPPRDFGPGRPAEQVELAKLFVDPEVECSLEIIGNRDVHGDEKNKFYTESKDDSPEQRSWDVLHESGGALKKRSPVGTFTLADQALHFKWFENAKDSAQPGKLQYCLLRIEVDGESQTCILSNPRPVEPLTLDLDAENPLIEIPLSSKDIPDKRYQRLDLQLEGVPEHKLSNASGRKVIVGDPTEENICDIQIPGGDGDDRMDDFLKIRLGFVYNEQSNSVRYGLRREEYLKLLVYYPSPRDQNIEQQAPQDDFAEITAEIAKNIRSECDPTKSKNNKYVKDRKPLQDRIRHKDRDLRLLQEKIKVGQKQRSDIQEKIGAIDKDLDAIQKEINQAVAGKNDAAAAAMKRALEQQVAGKRNQLLQEKLGLQQTLQASRPESQKLELKAMEERIPLNIDRKKLRDLDFNVSFRETNWDRLKKRAELVETIKDEGRIHFRVYVMIEGREIDVMLSSGFTR